MKINYLNFKPTAKNHRLLLDEFEELKTHFSADTDFEFGIEKINDIYQAHASIKSPFLNINSDMTGRTLDIIGPSLSMELKVKSALLLNDANIAKTALGA